MNFEAQKKILKVITMIGGIGFFVSLALFALTLVTSMMIYQAYITTGEVHTTLADILLQYSFMTYLPICVAMFAFMFLAGLKLLEII